MPKSKNIKTVNAKLRQFRARERRKRLGKPRTADIRAVLRMYKYKNNRQDIKLWVPRAELIKTYRKFFPKADFPYY